MTEPAPQTMNTAEAAVSTMIRNGIDTVFCLPGVQNDVLFDAFYKNQNALRPIHTRHEQGTAYMALGAAMATGKPAAYAVVPGPGLLNTTAALCTAYACSAPVLALTGQLGTAGGIVMAHIVVTLPFAWRPIAVAMARIDGEIVEAASLLGADERRIALGIALPLARSGLVTALLFSFIISFDEVTITMFLTGPQVTTLPVQIYAFIQENASPVLAAISTATVVVTLVVVMLLERLIGLEFFVAHDPA